MIYIENKKRKIEKIKEQYPNADILDITSSSELRYAQILSPFYPHGNIPIPFTDGLKATCVEAVWQGLKVFDSCDIDLNTFKNDTMKGLKRTVRMFTNTEFRDTSSPLSHAGLVKLYIEGNYPEKNVSYTPLSDAEIKQRKNEIKESKKVSKRRNKSKVEQLNIFKNE